MYRVENLLINVSTFFNRSPWTSSLGLSRSILAFGTFTNFVFNDSSILFRPGVGINDIPVCNYYNSFGLFCLLSDNLEAARVLSIIGLGLIVIGFLPRVTGILHWYVMFSYTTSATVLDGGDHITTIITFMLIPLTVTDKRTWHWSSEVQLVGHEITNTELARRIVAIISYIAIRIQVSLIYLNAAGAKLLVDEWQNGTAVYYWFTHPTFGAPNWLQPLILPMIQNEYGVTLITWGSIFLEFILFAGLFASSRNRKFMLFAGILFHFLIFLIHGLFSFFMAMSGALILYLWPIYHQIPLERITLFSYVRNKFQRT
jgi:antimicrobial peptide system SdpB family protein